MHALHHAGMIHAIKLKRTTRQQQVSHQHQAQQLWEASSLLLNMHEALAMISLGFTGCAAMQRR